jgi:hypothetical protein
VRLANKYRLLGALLAVAACGSLFGALVAALGAGLCEGQRPGVCEAQQNDHVAWLIAASVLAISAVAAFVHGARVVRREKRPSS